MSGILSHLKRKLGLAKETLEEVQAQASTAQKRSSLINAMGMMAGFGGAAAANSIFEQADREAAKAEKDLLYHQVGESNYKFCRKKCKMFKQCRCYEKTYDKQKACWEQCQGDPAKVIVEPEVVT